jgi:hypothetical protein
VTCVRVCVCVSSGDTGETGARGLVGFPGYKGPEGQGYSDEQAALCAAVCVASLFHCSHPG